MEVSFDPFLVGFIFAHDQHVGRVVEPKPIRFPPTPLLSLHIENLARHDEGGEVGGSVLLCAWGSLETDLLRRTSVQLSELGKLLVGGGPGNTCYTCPSVQIYWACRAPL